MTTALTIVKDDLQALAARINDEYRLTEQNRDSAIEHAQTAMQHALATGRLLIEAKSKVKHGEWMAWLSANTDVPQRTANKWMSLAQNGPEANLGVNEALRLLAEPKKRQADGREADVPSVPEALASHVDEPAADAPDLPSHPAALRLVPPVNGRSPSAPVVEHEAATPVASGESDVQPAEHGREADVPSAHTVVDSGDAALVDEGRIPCFPDLPNDAEGQVDYLCKYLEDVLAGAAYKVYWSGKKELTWQVQVAVWDHAARTCKETGDHLSKRHQGQEDWTFDQAPDEWLAKEVADTVDHEIDQWDYRFRAIRMEHVASAYRRIADHCTYRAELTDQFIAEGAAEDAAERERNATPAEETSTEQAEEQPARDAEANVPDGDNAPGAVASDLSQQADDVINQAWPEVKVPYRARMQSAVGIVLAAGANHIRLVAMLGKTRPLQLNAEAGGRYRNQTATMRMACVILNHYNGRRQTQNSAYIQRSALLAVASSTAATSQPAH